MHKLLFGLLLLSLSACSMPVNPDQLKQVATESALGAVEHYTVPVAYNRVVANLQSAAARCLNYDTPGIMSSHGWVALPARIKGEVRVLKPGQAQLTIQKNPGGLTLNGSEKPEGGWYTFVVDIAPASPSSANLTFYGGQFASGGFVSAVKTWAAGSDMSCAIL